MFPEGWSVLYEARAVFRVARSEILLESLDCLRSSMGFRTRMTTTARMAMMAMTMRSSTRVKALFGGIVYGADFCGGEGAVVDAIIV